MHYATINIAIYKTAHVKVLLRQDLHGVAMEVQDLYKVTWTNTQGNTANAVIQLHVTCVYTIM